MGNFSVSKTDCLKKAGLDRFIRSCESLVKGSPYGGTSGVGPNKILSLRQFLRLIYRYSNGDVSLDACIRLSSTRGHGEYFISFIGQTRRKDKVLNSKKAFTLSINDAYLKGVQPEQVRQFQKVFAIQNDPAFYQDSSIIDI